MKYVKVQGEVFYGEGWLIKTAEDLQEFSEKYLFPGKKNLQRTYEDCGKRPDRWGHLSFGNTIEQALHVCFIGLLPRDKDFNLSLELSRVVLKYLESLSGLLLKGGEGVLVNAKFGLNPLDLDCVVTETTQNRSRSIGNSYGNFIVLENDAVAPEEVFSYISNLPRGEKKGFVIINNVRETYNYFSDQRELRDIIASLKARGFASLLFMSSGTDLPQLKLFLDLWQSVGGKDVCIIKGKTFGKQAIAVTAKFKKLSIKLVELD